MGRERGRGKGRGGEWDRVGKVKKGGERKRKKGSLGGAGKGHPWFLLKPL